jgi:hypothetical protein
VRYLSSDPGVVCDSADHDKVKRIAIVLMVIWVFGSLGALVAVIGSVRRAKGDRRITRLMSATKFLHVEYDQTSSGANLTIYWEVVTLAE